MVKVSSELAKSLMESADWGNLEGVKGKLTESSEVQEKVVEDVAEDLVEEGLTDEDAQELAEAIENGDLHVCPLCETVLPEELSDEIVENHIDFVAGLLAEDVDEDQSNES